MKRLAPGGHTSGGNPLASFVVPLGASGPCWNVRALIVFETECIRGARPNFAEGGTPCGHAGNAVARLVGPSEHV